jgi:hypothetical protein
MKINEILGEGKRPGLWANIHAKRDRIKHGSGEHMRKPGSKGAPTAQAFKDAATEDVAEDTAQYQVVCDGTHKGIFTDKDAAIDNAKSMFKHEKEYHRIYVLDLNTDKPVWMWTKEHGLMEDWNKVNQHDKTDGMSSKAVKAYRREHPGSKLQTAVTTKPSKLKPGSKAAKRRKSFCARMSGNKGPMKDEKGRPTPKAKALRRWNCNEAIDMCAVCGQTPCNCTHINEGANPKIDLTPNYPNYSRLVGEFMGVKGNRYLFKIVDAEVKPNLGETEKIAKAYATGRIIGIEISRVKNRKVIGEN